MADPKQKFGPKSWRVRYVTAGASLAQLDAVAQKVMTAEPWRADVADKLISVGIDPARHAVAIGVESITPVIAADAALTFANLAVLDVVQPVQFLSNRLADTQPYWGGDRLQVQNGGGCTAGFAAYDPNSTGWNGMLTAGHCYGSGTTVPQAYYDNYGRYHKSGNMGVVTRRSFGNNSLDGEFMNAGQIGTTTLGWVYNSFSIGTNVADWGWSWVGETPCMDGSFTLENCTGSVQAIEQTVYISGTWITHLTKVTAFMSLCQPGDSGGPVYTHGQNGLIGYGLIDAGPPGGYTCYYTELGDALGVLNVGLLTG